MTGFDRRTCTLRRRPGPAGTRSARGLLFTFSGATDLIRAAAFTGHEGSARLSGGRFQSSVRLRDLERMMSAVRLRPARRSFGPQLRDGRFLSTLVFATYQAAHRVTTRNGVVASVLGALLDVPAGLRQLVIRLVALSGRVRRRSRTIAGLKALCAATCSASGIRSERAAWAILPTGRRCRFRRPGDWQ